MEPQTSNTTTDTLEPVFKIPRTKKCSKPIVPHKRLMLSTREMHDFKKKLSGLSKLLRMERGKLPQLQQIIKITLDFYKFVTVCAAWDYNEIIHDSIQASWKPIKQAKNILIRTIVSGDKFEDVVEEHPLKQEE
uniref:Histone domain-containing protein n=1 Tax=Caenorhabditis tropicalis TaxID=1561998 RepID=A0A1I7TLD9_9PELO